MIKYISVGQIIGVYGIKGELKVYPLTDNTKRFDNLDDVFIEMKNEISKFKVDYVKYLKNLVIVKLKGIDSVESAGEFSGKYIKVSREDAVKLPSDSYFICDLIDAEVFTVEGLYLGKIKDVIKTGSNDVYIVKNDENEVLIPALKNIFKKIDIENSRLIVELPEGLM
ncbi:MAG: ribosome maturation factor RimM [Firmicutes bacterium]|nr:ribosome maturation factor RimM [Bacillota bacterium]